MTNVTHDIFGKTGDLFEEYVFQTCPSLDLTTDPEGERFLCPVTQSRWLWFQKMVDRRSMAKAA